MLVSTTLPPNSEKLLEYIRIGKFVIGCKSEKTFFDKLKQFQLEKFKKH